MKSNNLIKQISKTLHNDARVVFAYFYGSMAIESHGNDIDILVVGNLLGHSIIK